MPRERARDRMPVPSPAAPDRARVGAWFARHWRALALWLGALAVIALAAPLITAAGLPRQVTGEMLALSFDAERAHLIALLTLALCCAAAAGVICLRRAPAWLGGTALFAVLYIWPFTQQALHPGVGIGGRPQVLVPGALAAAVFSLLAAGSLVAAVGAALGAALGRLLAPPLVALAWPLLKRQLVTAGAPGAAASGPMRPSPARAALSLATLALVLLSLVFGGQALGQFLSYGVSTQIYEAAALAQAHVVVGTVQDDAYVSEALGGTSRPFRIYLPPSYRLDPARRFPVLYLLHGAPGSYPNWFADGHAAAAEDALLAEHLIHETILVAPDGNGPVYRTSAWANSFDGRQRMEDAIATDLVRYVDAHYHTRPDAADRLIAGLSEGGFGAANIALHHPDVFSAAVCLSGFFRADSNPVFGGRHASTYRSLNSPADYVRTEAGLSAARRLRFILGAGTADGAYYYDGTTAFARQLTDLDVDTHYMESPGGHSWSVWGQQLADALRQLESLAGTAPSTGRA
jgi:enterochelin esterase-like enzyme